MNELYSTPHIIRAFGLTPDGFALARVIGSGESPEAGAADSDPVASRNSDTPDPAVSRNKNNPDPMDGRKIDSPDFMDGDAIHHASMAGRIVLCDGLMPGETAEVLLDDIGSRLLNSRLVRILERSPDRAEPFCPVYAQCGGCTCQELTYEALLREKQRHVRDCLIRIARIPEARVDTLLLPIMAAKKPTEYRNHMQYQVRLDDATGDVRFDKTTGALHRDKLYRDNETGAIRFGLHAKKSHETVATPRCAIAHPVADLIKNTVEQYLNEPQGHAIRARIPPHTKLIVRVGTRTGQVLYRLQIPEGEGFDASDAPNHRNASDRREHDRRVSPDRRSRERRFAPPDRRNGSAYNSNSPDCGSSASNRRDSAPTNHHRLVTVANFDTRIRQALRAAAPDYTLVPNEIEEQIGRHRYFISPESFFQVNTDQAERLYDTVLQYFEQTGSPSDTRVPEYLKQEKALSGASIPEYLKPAEAPCGATVPEYFKPAEAPCGATIPEYLKPAEAPCGATVLDLYCGTGSIGLHLSGRARRIIGIESNAQTVEDARRNAQINTAPNAEFHVGIAEEYDYKSLDASAPLTIVLDPPRKGCAPRLLEKLIALAPDHILYVSCDPATLSRDLRFLIEKGYHPEAAQPVDVFPWTGHVETVVLITRVKE